MCMRFLQRDNRKASNMNIIKNEINGLMVDLHEIAIADTLPYFCPEAPGRAARAD
ncbi:hypothetical protein GCM10027317_42100 [Massilia agri]